MASNPLLRLPPAMAILLLASIATAVPHVPRQTSTITLPHRTLDVVPFPTLAKGPELGVRQEPFNTVCGFIGGNPNIPAICQAGSHCVLDAANGVVGCCPNGGPCTTGIFTGCVDFNSGPQSVADPYVFTCTGGKFCYQNEFEEGFAQFGCGTASSLGTSVAFNIPGLTTLPLTTLFLQLTETPSSLSVPITLPNPSSSQSSVTVSPRPSSGSGSSTFPSPSSKSSSSTSTTPSRPTRPPLPTLGEGVPTAAPEEEEDSPRDRTGAIIGGTLSGAAVLIFLIAMCIYFWGRHKGNVRKGPGLNTRTQYISAVPGKFAPVSGKDPSGPWKGTDIQAGEPVVHTRQVQAELNAEPGPSTYTVSGAMPPPQGHYSDTTPLRSAADVENQHRFHAPLSQIGEEDEDVYNQQAVAELSRPQRFNSRRLRRVHEYSDLGNSNIQVGGHGDLGVDTNESASRGVRPFWQQGRQ